ncbi:hypothetical protein AAFN85_15900 [Mucilaginibacter sp. CAU 1740]|jgi:hypothetical protein|uniref:hypothetical protein n=1 Tax=Mucilaginibacter sp. CAU 1740 TaxID=3140365 RepID=UPI00325B0549
MDPIFYKSKKAVLWLFRIFRKKAVIINCMVKSMFMPHPPANLKLDDQFKDKLQHLIENRLKK